MQLQEFYNQTDNEINNALAVIEEMGVKVLEKYRIEKIMCDELHDSQKASLTVQQRPAWNIFEGSYAGQNWNVLLIADGNIVFERDGIKVFDMEFDKKIDRKNKNSSISLKDERTLTHEIIPRTKQYLIDILAPEDGDWISKFPDAKKPTEDNGLLYEICKYRNVQP